MQDRHPIPTSESSEPTLTQRAEGPFGLSQADMRRAMLVGLSGSLSLHLLLMIIAALMLVGRGGNSGSELGEPGEVQLAITTQSELAALEQLAADLPSIPVPALDQPEVPELETLELSELSEASSSSSLADRALESLGAGDLTGSSELSTGGGGEGSVSFFGAEAFGRRIAFVMDMSGSMGSGGKIEVAQRELGRSLEELRAPMEFFVAMFNNSGFALEGFEKWTEASQSRTREARRMFAHRASTELGGTTYPVPAFELVFALRPLPDAIFFMTDGDFSDDDATTERILALNQPHKIPVHCVTFIDRSAEPRMRRIAEASGGTYTHIDGTARRGP